MEGYLGDKIVDIKDTPFCDFEIKDWMKYYIEFYGSFDGEDHKKWVMDQCMRIYYGTSIIIKKAEWKNNYFEFRVTLGEATEEYLSWRNMMENESGVMYDVGIAP
jgi:hypothetical protein